MAISYWETFKLSQLRLDEENFRIGDQSSQRDAILALIEDQKQKLVFLAKDLIEEGPSPGEPIWVTKDESNRGMYVVLEGNRRVAALKLLENPALADGTVVEKHFRNLSKIFLRNPRRELEARVFASRKDAAPWIRRRHMTQSSGVALQRWKPLAKGRADRQHGLKTPKSLAVVEFLDDGSEAWHEVEEVLDSRWTTVDRVLNTKAFREELGVAIDNKTGTITFENGNATAGKALLLRVLRRMASADFDFSEVEKVGHREAFVQQFVPYSVKAKKKGKGKSTTKVTVKPSASPAPVMAASKAAQASTARETLAPKTGSRVIRVSGPRLNPLYNECRNIRVKDNENAAAFLLRVFIELSSEELLVRRKVVIPAKYQAKGKLAWDTIGIPLDVKIVSVADHLDPKKNTKSFQQARLAVHQSPPTVFSTATLHGYFHNRQLIPDAASIKAAWDAWEAYLTAVHTDLENP
jgi:hypothetical protein